MHRAEPATEQKRSVGEVHCEPGNNPSAHVLKGSFPGICAWKTGFQHMHRAEPATEQKRSVGEVHCEPGNNPITYPLRQR